MSDDVQHQTATDIGRPTTLLDENEPVELYQRASVGHRFYGNKLGASEGRTGAVALQHSVAPAARSNNRQQTHTNNTTGGLSANVQQQIRSSIAYSSPSKLRAQRTNAFKMRIVKQVVSKGGTDEVSVRRNKRLLGELSKGTVDGNISHTICESFASDGTPNKGMSQSVKDTLLLYTKSPGNDESNNNEDSNENDNGTDSNGGK